jgi:hypothetical protein
MSYPKKYFWKNNEGNVVMSMGIALTKGEQLNLIHTNLKMIKEQTNATTQTSST